jgi:ferredoxin-NADP reductase
LSLLFSQVKTLFVYGLSHKATITMMPSGMIKVQIPVHHGGPVGSKAALKMTWKPGQHVFIRFLTLGLNALTAHPFSICSLHKTTGEECELVLYIQPQGGLTRRLAVLAERSPGISIPIMLEGPYGGLHTKSFAQFDRAVIIAGGSGAGFTLPIVEDILHNKTLHSKGRTHMTRIQVVISTRSHEVREWYAQEIEYLLQRYQAYDFVQVDIGVTQASGSYSPSFSGDEKGMMQSKSYASSASVNVTAGRPNIGQWINSAVSATGESVGIAVCGPVAMVHDVRVAAAEAQFKVLGGRGASEVYLHSENFS